MSRTNPQRLAVLAILLVVVPVFGCRSGRVKEDPILRLAAAESLAEGKALMERGKHVQARKYLVHAFEVEPNSASGREALLLVADSLFEQGGTDNLVQAEAKYRDFLNRFPTSDRAAYVQYQIGKALGQRVEKPDRDQTVTRQAVEAFREVQRLFPGTAEAEAAGGQIARLRHLLAEHEVVVAEFYLRYGLPEAAVKRLERVLDDYPDYPARDQVYFRLGTASSVLGQQEEANEWFARLRDEFPSSELVDDIPGKG